MSHTVSEERVLSDEELDQDWKPNGRRPQSTIAKSFSLELMDIFRIEESVADLDEKVDKRKQLVNSQTSELQALEARIREMEAMLSNQQGSRRTVSSGDASTSAAANLPSGTSRPTRPSLNGVFDNAPTDDATPRPLEHRQRQQPQDAQKYAGSRPGTARASQQAVPGALPPTPVGSEDGDGERF